jgi:cell division septation protein DedD
MNTNRIIELALVFFISLFSFSIGTFVGKKYSDNQHRLALLEPNKKTEERQAIENTTAHSENTTVATGAESEITDADVAKMAEEFSTETESAHGEMANTETHTTGDTHANAAATTSKTGTKNVKSISSDAKDVKEVTLSESEDEHERDVASIPVKAKSLGTYTVQVGSYPSEVEADKMTESLLARGYKASAVPANVNGKTMYRVQVGLFNSFSDAQEYKKELMEKNRLTSAFVQKVSK